MIITPVDRPELWHGALSWEELDDGWLRPWRLNPADARLAYADDLFDKARCPAGVRAALVTDATDLMLRIRTGGDEPASVDLVIDGEFISRRQVGPETSDELRFDLPGGEVTAELWLPHAVHTDIVGLQVSGGNRLEPAESHGPRWVTYGSSITHCRAAFGPSQTWPALVARERDWDLTCLGFGGQCHLDPTVARTLANEPADVISLCLGINVYGGASYARRTWPGRVADFLQTIRAGHPHTPILVITPIISPAREDTPNGAGLTLVEIRALLSEVVNDLQDLGDDRIHLLDGLTVMGSDDVDLLHDGLHPGATGYVRMAERIGPALDTVLA